MREQEDILKKVMKKRTTVADPYPFPDFSEISPMENQKKYEIPPVEVKKESIIEFCHDCGKKIIDEKAKICQYCSSDLSD